MSLIARIRQAIGQPRRDLYNLCQVSLDESLTRILGSPKYQDPKKLNRYEHKVFSQGGEDGIVAEIFNRIGATNRIFAECAPGDGLVNNTRYLLAMGWKGLWIECDPGCAKTIHSTFSERIRNGELSVRHHFITAENIESLLEQASLPADFDFLSIDLDCNDYWVWQKIQRYRPRVVVIEYNAIFPPGCTWIVDYNPKKIWDGTSNFGASLTAFELLAEEKGYKLVGCSMTGVNAFFVREDLVQNLFCGPFTAKNHYEPPRYYLSAREAGHPRSIL